MNKKEIILNSSEIEVACLIHKEMMESIARVSHKYEIDKNFEIVSVAIAFTICNTLSSFGINKIDPYLSDMIDCIKSIHSNVRSSSSYMQYKDGKKVSEGRFN